MLVIGSILALISGMLNAGAAALEKREGMRLGTGRKGARLLAVLARRPLWLLAMALSAVAWVAEAASLALAPVPVVATVRNAGRGLLVVAGGRWLDEHFTRLELAGVALASAGGALTTVSAAGTAVTRRPLSNLTELAVGVSCLVGAGAVTWCGSRLAADDPARARVAGVATGAAVGLLFAATGVFTKEIGDRFAAHGARALLSVIASAGLWLMLAMAAWAQSLLQQAFRKANAATVSAANASVASLGLICAGFALYGQVVPRGAGALALVGGIAVSLTGTAMLLGARSPSRVNAKS
jgi:drug/metabolite transporter (DMT)-like permease